MELTAEMRRLIARARERIAEQNAYDEQQRASDHTLADRYPEFCGAFRELLDMLVCELEGAAPAFTDGQDTASMRASAWGQMAERQRTEAASAIVPTGIGWPVT